MVAIVLLFASCGGDGEPAAPEPEVTATVAAPTASPPSPEPTAAVPTTGPTARVTVFFSTGDGTDCGEVSPITRTIEVGESGEPGLGDALTALLAGPTDAEMATGAGSWLSRETAGMLEVVDLTDPDRAIVGFGDLASVIPNASTSCGSEALLAQLNRTVLQFVPRVRYQMLGSCPLFANWLQRECMEYTAAGAEPAALTILERARGSGCTPWDYGPLDGDWFGYVESVADTEIEFDLACWFDGDAAVEASAEDGEESPPPNDYYIRNADDAVSTVPVAADASITWLPDTDDPTSETVVGFDEWVRLRDDRAFQPGVWLKVRNGQVVAITELYVP